MDLKDPNMLCAAIPVMIATKAAGGLGWLAATPASHGRAVEGAARHAMIASLFQRLGSLTLHGVVSVGQGLILAWWLDSWEALAWSIAECLLIGLRICLSLCFIRPQLRVRFPMETWGRCYVVTGLLSSVTLGTLAAGAMLAADRTVALPVAACVVGIACILACRNAVLPRLAVAQIIISTAPLSVSVLLVPEHFYRMVCLTDTIFVLGLEAVVGSVYRDVAGMLLATEDNAGLARNDVLTGVANRRHFDERLERFLADPPEERAGFALLLLDIDHFKLFNDHYGHIAGDACLRDVAQILAGGLRERDALARYGGEEFAVLITCNDPAYATALANRLCAAVANARLAHLARRDELSVVTVSIGGTWIGAAWSATGQKDVSAASIVQRADAALYQAKRDGRNRACLAAAPQHDDDTYAILPTSQSPVAVNPVAADSASLELLRRSAILPEKAAPLRLASAQPAPGLSPPCHDMPASR